MMMKLISAAALTVALAVPSVAATLNGTFTVTVVNAQNRNSAQSQATLENFDAALASAKGSTPGYAWDAFTYTGNIDFKTLSGATQIDEWLATAVGGLVTGLLPSVGDLLLSKGNINSDPGTATTTFFMFALDTFLDATRFDVRHDDGMQILDLDDENPVVVGGFVGPNSVRSTYVPGFDGGNLGILYVATNGNPSILNVAAVPVPAAGFLLIGALGGLAAMRRRKQAV
ncbi:MAG: VPLPA-CTERM sorting domain-containing protein [Paracoccaceae bacterium]